MVESAKMGRLLPVASAKVETDWQIWACCGDSEPPSS